MTRKEYEQKKAEYYNIIHDTHQKQRELDRAYADSLARLNGLKAGDIIKDECGTKFAFAYIRVEESAIYVWGKKLLESGAPSIWHNIVFGYKLKEE